MRQIRIRAWDVAESKMLYDFGEPIGGEGGLLLYLVTQMEDMTIGVVREGDGNQLPIMQFTGLLDKNGREIYEGDLVKAIVTDVNGYIVWHNGRFCWTDNACHWDMVDNEKHDNQPKENKVDICAEMEVIGNIYENPELLDGGKE